jgi:hypothetical protein
VALTPTHCVGMMLERQTTNRRLAGTQGPRIEVKQQQLPDKPPRGHKFIVAWFSHVAGPGITLKTSERIDTRSAAERKVDGIDRRLTPHIVIVESRGAA